MNWGQIVEICCRDLRRYLEHAVQTTRGSVVSVKMRRLLRAELSPSDCVRYARCLSRILHQWRWGGAYVIPRQDAEMLLASLDAFCELAKRRRQRRGGRRYQRLGGDAALVSVTLPFDLLRALDEYAARAGMSRSAAIALAVQQLIETRDAPKPVRASAPLAHVTFRVRTDLLATLAHVTFRVRTDLLATLDRYAATLKAPRSALVRYALERLLLQAEPQTAP